MAEGAERLVPHNRKRKLAAESANDEVALSSDRENTKSGRWSLAHSLAVQVKMDSCVLESELHAVQHVPAKGRGKPVQLIPIRFAFKNKLARDDRLLLAFDLFRAYAKIHWYAKSRRRRRSPRADRARRDDGANIGPVSRGGRKRIEKITALLSSPTPPDLVLNRHCAECEFQVRCRENPIEKDDLSLQSGMTQKVRERRHGIGIFTVTNFPPPFTLVADPENCETSRRSVSTR